MGRREVFRTLVETAIAAWGDIELASGERYSPYDFQSGYLKGLDGFDDDPNWEWNARERAAYNGDDKVAWVDNADGFSGKPLDNRNR